MTRHLTAILAGLAAAAATVHTHHSIAGVYDSSRQLRLEAVVTAFHFVNPHPFVEVEAADALRGQQRWRLEMDNRFELTAEGMTADTLMPGDRIRVVGSEARDGTPRLYVRSLERPADGFLYEQVGSRPRVRLPRR